MIRDEIKHSYNTGFEDGFRKGYKEALIIIKKSINQILKEMREEKKK